ncbi:MAG: hypothetical protein K9J30_08830 [Bacteroidales bacterium]|nr:hypothetical protein [Bacteroidales bacterium]
MKSIKAFRVLFVIFTATLIINPKLYSQTESKVTFDAGADIVSNYIWRGVKYGAGPAIQPFVEFSAGNFALGSWGSFAFTDSDFSEADLYLSYGFDFGLSIGLTDYYYPGTSYFDYSTATGSHGFEVNFGYELSGLSIGANYMLNQAPGAGTAGGDMYFELGYSFEMVSVFAGGGNGWHSSDGSFALCNIEMSVSKEIEITEKFSLPLSGSLILNPDTQQYYIVAAVSF